MHYELKLLLKKIDVIIGALFNAYIEIKLSTELNDLILSRMTKVESEVEIVVN